LRSGMYKLKGDPSGTHCGALSDEEKAELEGMTLEHIKMKWARVDPRMQTKSSAYRGVGWCVACEGMIDWAEVAFSRHKASKKWQMEISDKAAGRRIHLLCVTEVEVWRLNDLVYRSSEPLFPLSGCARLRQVRPIFAPASRIV